MAAVLSACGGGSVNFEVIDPGTTIAGSASTTTSSTVKDSSPIAGIDPCKLATKDEAAEALGASVADPSVSSQGDSLECTFVSTDVAKVGDEVSILVTPAAIFDLAADDTDSSTYVYEKVEGIGDAALAQHLKVQLGEGTAGDVLIVKVGDVAVHISVVSQTMGHGEAIQSEKKLAAKAIERLKP